MHEKAAELARGNQINSKKAGDSLRDQIAQLLRMKFQNVEVEKRLEITTADVFFVDDTNPIFPRTIAVEAKDWKTPLTSENIASIYNLYAPSLNSRSIDYLWIVGRRPLSGSPKQSLDKLPSVRYSSFDEFRASLMNFNGLLNNNIHLFEHNDAAKNFVHTRVRQSGQRLFDYVIEWISSGHSGLMVYGGYGLGKTTFSLYLASELSERYLLEDFDRIPIRIALGGMYSKQDLIALICSALSGGESGVAVKDFSYGLFLEMNRQGRYLLILDGFDEMRHAMDLDDFVYTFEQMKPLFAGQAKVIILGRPDSFLTTLEEDQILSSLFDSAGEQNSRLSKVEVAFFTKSEVEGYLHNFLNSRSEKLSENQQKNFLTLMQRLPDSEDSILSRPVQLKMFTKIIDECLASDLLLNRYELYKRFIYNFLSRESQKSARQPGSISGVRDLKDDRAKFMQAMAWWVLNGKKENRFLPEEIPTEIIPSTIRSGLTNSAAIREALVGSVIEPISHSGVLGSKARKYYFFPHKSYLEFLIANYFDANRFSMDMYREFMGNVNNEILTFLEEGPPTGIDNLRTGLMHNLGVIDARIIEVCATDKRIENEIDNSSRYNHAPSHIYTHYFFLKKKGEGAEQYLLARLIDSVMVDSALATLTCIASELASAENLALARALILSCITTTSSHNLRNFAETGAPFAMYHADIEGLRAALLARCIKCSKKEFVIDIEQLHDLAQNASRGTMFVHIPSSGSRLHKAKVPSGQIVKGSGAGFRRNIEKIISDRPAPEPFFTVRLLGEAGRFDVMEPAGRVRTRG